MPMNRKLYPANWEEMSARLKAEVGNQCEQCGAPNGRWIQRKRDNPMDFAVVDSDDPDDGTVSVVQNEEWEDRIVFVQLGVAHLDQNPANNERSNLRVLCRRCHLVYDNPFHQVKARRTRLMKKQQAKLEAGQLLMFTGVEQ